MKPPKNPCGTWQAYARHKKAREEADDACREAWNAYQAEYKASHPPSAEQKEALRLRASARGRALWRLRLENDRRYQEIYLEELLGDDDDD